MDSIERTRYYLDGTFVVETRPRAHSVRATGVVILPPLTHEDSAAYRPLRVLADSLAEQGHVVLRLDWPSLGDSALDDAAPDLPERWRAAASVAARSLRSRGFPRVAGIGVRAGGLLALAAEGFDELVLWAIPTSGKAYLREERAFQRVAARSFGTMPNDRPEPDGVEAGGFLHRPATVAALERLDAAELARRPARRRVLLLEPDGAGRSKPLVEAFQAAGVDVRLSSCHALADLLDDPYRTRLDPDVRAAVTAWLSEERARVTPGPAPGELALDLAGLAERPWVTRGDAGELSGIICEPAGGVAPGAAWTVFFNAGGIRRSGPCRLWTRAARALAARGRPSLRFDVHDVGDSDGASEPRPTLDEIYGDGTIADALLAVDWVHARRAGTVDVVGLCSGAFLGAQISARRRVRRALLFNCLAYVWNEGARASGMTAQIRGSLLNGRRWRRLLTGRIDARQLMGAIVTRGRLEARGVARRLQGKEPPDEVDALLGEVRERGTRLHLVSSEGDPSVAYLERHVPPGRRPRLTIIPGVDHTLRPVWAHESVLDLILQGGQGDPGE